MCGLAGSATSATPNGLRNSWASSTVGVAVRPSMRASANAGKVRQDVIVAERNAIFGAPWLVEIDLAGGVRKKATRQIKRYTEYRGLLMEPRRQRAWRGQTLRV